MKKEYAFSDELDEFSMAYDEEPDYKTPLFHNDEREGYYFESESRADLAKKLSHLIEYTKLVLFVKGEEQVGKTALLQHRFVGQTKSSWRVCIIDALRHKNAQSILKALARDLGISELDQKNKQSAERFVEQLNEFRQNNEHAILVVDNAQNLSQEAAELVAQLSQFNEQLRPLLRTVLFGNKFPDKLDALLREMNGNEPVKTLQLDPLTLDETESFIGDGLKRLNIDQLGPFTEQRMLQIHQQAKGLHKPTRILAQAVWQSYIDNAGNAGKAAKPSRSTNVKKILHIASGGLAVALIASLIFFVSSKSGSDKNDFSAQQTTEVLTLPGINEEASTSSEHIAVNDHAEQTVVVAQTKPAATQEPVTMLPATPTVQADNGALPVEALAAVTPPPANNALVETKEIVTPAVTTPPPVKAKAKQIASANSPWQRENWLAIQNNKNYTVQILGSSKELAVQRFIKNNKLEKKAAYFHSHRDNKDWYTVVYGVYSDKEAAAKASAEIKKTLKIPQPWVRSMASVHKDIGLESFASQ